MPAGDPIVTKVRMLLQAKHMSVTGREVHNGVEAWKISLNRNAGRPVWTLWVSATDGRPLELRDPGRDASEAPQLIRWSTYEMLRGSLSEDELLDLGMLVMFFHGWQRFIDAFGIVPDRWREDDRLPFAPLPS